MEIEGSSDPGITLSNTTTHHRILNSTLADERSSEQYNSMNALEILNETIRVLRYNLWGFILILALLISPVSIVLLSNLLVDKSIVKRLTTRFLLVAQSSGLPIRPFIKHSCYHFSDMVISTITSFPLYISLLLLSKVAVVHAVDCTYSVKKFSTSISCKMVVKIWQRVLWTYMLTCFLITGCVSLFIMILIAVCCFFSLLGFSPDTVVYPAMLVSLVFSIVFANVIMVCNIGIVISVVEDVSGAPALLRSGGLIKGQTQVGMVIYLGSTIGMAFVEGLFEHRVKTLSYGDGSSRAWEGPLLVIMYSFVVLLDFMMSAVFYFSCRSCRPELGYKESQTIVEAI